MARSFNGSTNRIDYSNVQNPNATAHSFFTWINLDSFDSTSKYIWIVHQSGDAALGTIYWIASDNKVYASIVGTSNRQRNITAASPFSTGSWHHVGYTYDGTSSTTAITHYIDGSPPAMDTGAAGTSLFSASGSWSLGGRIFDDNRNIDADLAEPSYFNVELTAGEVASQAKAFSPKFARPANRLFHTPLVRDPNDLHGKTATLDGTTVVPHPRIINPSAQILSFPTAAAPPVGAGKSHPLMGPLGGPLSGSIGL